MHVFFLSTNRITFFFFECGKLQPKEKGVPLRCEAFERAM